MINKITCYWNSLLWRVLYLGYYVLNCTQLNCAKIFSIFSTERFSFPGTCREYKFRFSIPIQVPPHRSFRLKTLLLKAFDMKSGEMAFLILASLNSKCHKKLLIFSFKINGSIAVFKLHLQLKQKFIKKTMTGRDIRTLEKITSRDTVGNQRIS